MNHRCGAIPSPRDERDHYVSDRVGPSLLPPRTRNADGLAARDQGEHPTCVAMSLAVLKRWQEARDVGADDEFSPAFVYAHRANYPDGGMMIRDSLKIIQRQGCCFEDDWPYEHVEKPPDEIPPPAFVTAGLYTAGEYARVETVEDAKRALYRGGPFVAVLPVHHSGRMFWHPHGGDSSAKPLGWHQVLVVDYDDADGWFTVLNSWGTDWGDGGWTYLGYHDWHYVREAWAVLDEDSTGPERWYPARLAWYYAKRYMIWALAALAGAGAVWSMITGGAA